MLCCKKARIEVGLDKAGLTIQLIFGRWGGVHAGLLTNSFHITVGWVSFQMWFFDMDKYIKQLQDGYQHMYEMAGWWHKKYQDEKCK